MSYMHQDMETVSGKKFFVFVAAATNGAHQPIVEEFKGEGWTEVTSPGECDYLLVFCPVASQVGTDIGEALDHVPAGMKAVLVVMHHTFNLHHVIAPSSRLVQNPDIDLTADCLFHENRLLNCDLNNKMWREVYNFLGVSQESICRIFSRWMKRGKASCSELVIWLYGIFAGYPHFFQSMLFLLFMVKGKWPVTGGFLIFGMWWRFGGRQPRFNGLGERREMQ